VELALATTEDIVTELNRRRIRFVLVAVEDTNTSRDDLMCVAGRGNSSDDLLELIEVGQAAITTIDDEGEEAGEDF